VLSPMLVADVMASALNRNGKEVIANATTFALTLPTG
jgi:hypothetical protein